MIEALSIFFFVLCIWYTMQPGEIFEVLGYILKNTFPKKFHPPLFECNVCMTPWFGSILYWIIYGHGWEDWLFTVFIAMGMQIVLNKLSPEKSKNKKHGTTDRTDAGDERR